MYIIYKCVTMMTGFKCTYCCLCIHINVRDNDDWFQVYLLLPLYTDINECSTDNAGCFQICDNFIGSYQCLCHPGYELMEDQKNCTGVYIHKYVEALLIALLIMYAIPGFIVSL